MFAFRHSLRRSQGGFKVEPLVGTPAKARKPRGQGRSVPGISYQCKQGRHYACAKRTCTCDCGHGGLIGRNA